MKKTSHFCRWNYAWWKKTLLVMKIASFFLLLALHVSAKNFGQESINLNLKNATLSQVFKAIEKQSSYRFFYSNDVVSNEKQVGISVKDASLIDVMNRILNGSALSWKLVDGKLVVISEEDEKKTAKEAVDISLVGTIKDDRGVPLAGVTVSEKGTTNATTTDEKGNFRIKVKDAKSVLEFSYIGFQTQAVTVGQNAAFDISLKPDTQTLSEIVVVGYGTQKRSDVTGSVASVPKSRFTQLPVTNIMQAIQGAVAGVNVSTASQVPGRTASVQVRGISTVAGGTGPLIVVDGIPLSPDASTNDINANDVASMDILKDASATAIYGVRGANGVILITTKRGTIGKPVIRYNVYSGVENLIKTLHPSSPERFKQKWADYKLQNSLTADTSVLSNLYERNNYYSGTKTADWTDLTTQTGTLQDHNISISGGSQDVKYYISGEYLKQKGAVLGYQYQRINLRSNLDVNITSYLSAGTSLYFNNNNTDGGRINFYLGQIMSPYGTVYNATGGYEIYPMYGELLYTNPLLNLSMDRIERDRNITGNVHFEVKPTFVKGLKYRINASYSTVNGRFASYEGRSVNNLLGTATTWNSESKYWVIENIITYNKDFGKHHIDVTALYSSQEKTYFRADAGATGFFNDQLSFNNLAAGATQTSSSFYDKKNNLSQMGRVNYSYDSRYLLTLTARRDGASVFGANTDKYGLFPAIALGWNINNENFMKDNKWINSLKLRASYGRTGNEAVTINRTATTAASNRFPFNGVSTIGVLASNLGNKDLHWENTTGLNIGVDFSILKSRVSGSIEYYNTTTTDMLLTRNLPIITGYANIIDNLGKIKNKGLDFTLNTVNISTRDFKWETSLNLTTYKNTVAGLYGNFDSTGNEISDIGQGLFIGQPRSVIYDYTLDGVWQVGEDPSKVDASAKPGYLKFRDLNKDGKIDAADKSVIGSRLPKWSGGITNTFHYKNVHLSVFIQTSQGALRNNVNLTFADEGGRMNIPEEISYWTTTNPINDRPSLNAQAVSATRGYGYPKDASYTRIKDVTLSYTASSKLLDKIKLSGLTFYISGRNLHTFTKWVGWDPEQDFTFRGSGDWVNNYPPVRSIVFGANITLR